MDGRSKIPESPFKNGKTASFAHIFWRSVTKAGLGLPCMGNFEKVAPYFPAYELKKSERYAKEHHSLLLPSGFSLLPDPACNG